MNGVNDLVKKCSKCGKEYGEEDMFCMKCGVRLVASEVNSNSDNSSSVGCFVLVVIVLIILAAFGSCFHDDDDDAGAFFDWGDGHYWDTNDHTVKEKPW